MQFYRVSGLSVASEIDLPGLIAGTPELAPQVTIRRGPVPESLPATTASGPTWLIAGKQFLFRIPDIARFLLNDGSEIVVAPESEASVTDIPIFILGTMFGILLHQREQIVLHASAVRVNGKAVLFCGSSGAGKSTLAAALAQRGYLLVTDDFSTVTAEDLGAPLVHPDGRSGSHQTQYKCAPAPRPGRFRQRTRQASPSSNASNSPSSASKAEAGSPPPSSRAWLAHSSLLSV